MKKEYLNIVKHYEKCLKEFGDSYKGVDWPNKPDALKRYKVMLEVFKFDLNIKNNKNLSFLDLGCGTALLLDFILENGIKNLDYTGMDISPKFIDFAKNKYPEINFMTGDILGDDFEMSNFDYIVMNGVFTEKRELSYNRMMLYFKEMIKKIFTFANRGIAFNVMSKNVDWERDDLFHLPLDDLTLFLTKQVSRNFIIRNDYGLYEYTVYLYK